MAAGKTRASSLIGIGSLHICVDVRFGSLADLFDDSSVMAAFPESGRSGTPKTTEIRVRFRPGEDVEASPFRYSKYQLLLHPFTGFRQRLPVARHRVIKANQLQYFVVFHDEYCV